jgi:hypothetical protein
MALIVSTVLAIAAYFLKNEVFDPLQAFRAERWKVATVLVVHENVLVNSDMSTAEAKADVRRLAAELLAQYKQIPMPGLCSRLRMAPPPVAVGTAFSQLIGLSNSMKGGENAKRIACIRTQLRIS